RSSFEDRTRFDNKDRRLQIADDVGAVPKLDALRCREVPDDVSGNHDNRRPELGLNEGGFTDDQCSGGMDVAFGSAVEYHRSVERAFTVQLRPFGDDRRRVRCDSVAALPSHHGSAEASTTPDDAVRAKTGLFQELRCFVMSLARHECRSDVPRRCSSPTKSFSIPRNRCHVREDSRSPPEGTMAKFFGSHLERKPVDRTVLRWLTQLPDTFYVFVELQGGDFQVDFLVLKQDGIFNVEAKNWNV